MAVAALKLGNRSGTNFGASQCILMGSCHLTCHLMLGVVMPKAQMQRCARFPEIVQNFSEYQILWSLCLVVFLALTLNLPIQTSLSVASKLTVGPKMGKKFRKTSTPQVYGDAPLPLENGGNQFPSCTLYKSTNLMKTELGSNLMLMLMLTLLLTLSMF